MAPRRNLICHLAFTSLLVALISQHNSVGLRRLAGVDPSAGGPEMPQAMQMSTQPGPPMPVVITPSDHSGATARRGRDGHFYVDAAVNGVHVPMMLDTGATMVVLRAEDAAKVGINPNALDYSVRGLTANGVSEEAPVTIGSLTIGDITRHDVAAHVARPGKLFNNLLGQSFLARIAGFNVEGDQLILKGGR